MDSPCILRSRPSADIVANALTHRPLHRLIVAKVAEHLLRCAMTAVAPAPIVPVVMMPPAPDQLSILSLVTTRLDTAAIPYMITGSIAAGHYARPRMTRDIDLVVALEPADADRLASLFRDQFECDVDAIRSAISRQSLFNLIHPETIVKVDFIVRKDTVYRQGEFARRRRVDIDGHAAWMVSPEDLLLSKLLWAKDSRSELQLSDVKHLMNAQPGLDWPYIDRWAEELGVAQLLDETRR